MKKIVYSVLLVALLFVTLFATTGCGKKGLVGSWETSGFYETQHLIFERK